MSDGDGIKTGALKAAVELLKGQPFGNLLSLGILSAMCYGVYGGVPYVMDRLDKMVSGIDSTVHRIESGETDRQKNLVSEFRDEQKETRAATREHEQNWDRRVKSINDRLKSSDVE